MSDLYDEYEAFFNERLDDIDRIIEESIAAANENTSTICDVIATTAESVGINLSDSMEKIWASSGTTFPLTDEVTTITKVVQNIYNLVAKSYESTNTNKTVSNLVSAMKENSLDWYAASGTEKDALVAENSGYAATIAALTGSNVYRDSNGEWWIDGKKLFSVYHNGVENGFVGGIRDDEALAILQNGEAVLTEDQWRNITDTLSTGLGESVNSIVEAMLSSASVKLPNSIISTISADTLMPSIGTPAFSGNISNQFETSFTLPNVRNYEEFVTQMQGDKRFEQYIQTVTVDALAGKNSLNKYKTKW